MISRIVLVLAFAALAAGAARAGSPQPEVLLIGDSVATGMLWHDDALAIVDQGYDVEWQVAICRTTAGQSCPFDGERPPSLLELVETRTSVPPVVVVETGYNDFAQTFPASVDEAIDALVARGAQDVLWLTLREKRAPYPQLNAMLAAAVTRHPQLRLVDWDEIAAPHYGWFQSDGVHLLPAGGVAMAHLVHGEVAETLSPLRAVTTSLPPLRRHRPYYAALRFAGGTAPYALRVVSGAFPRGVHLRPDGRLTGTPQRDGRLHFQLRVTDADGVDTLVQY